MKYHKKNNLIALLTTLFLLLTFTLNSYSDSRYILVHPNGKKNAIHFRSFSGKKYISFIHIRDLLFRSHKISLETNEISSNHERFRATSGSFYLLYEKSNQIRIAQMTSPAITVKNMLYLPMISFFRSLPTLDLYYVSIEGNRIILRNEKHVAKKRDTKAGRTYEGTFQSDMPVTGDEYFEGINDRDFLDDEFDEHIKPNDFNDISDTENKIIEEKEFEADDPDADFITEEDTYTELEEIEDESDFFEEDKKEDFDKEPIEDDSFFDVADIDSEQDFKIRSLPKAKEKEPSFTQPALKFSFLYSANYIKEGFENISTTHSKSIRRDIKDKREPDIEKKEVNTKTKAIEAETKKTDNNRKSVFPPNVYVLPKNLIRRELNK